MMIRCERCGTEDTCIRYLDEFVCPSCEVTMNQELADTFAGLDYGFIDVHPDPYGDVEDRVRLAARMMDLRCRREDVPNESNNLICCDRLYVLRRRGKRRAVDLRVRLFSELFEVAVEKRFAHVFTDDSSVVSELILAGSRVDAMPLMVPASGKMRVHGAAIRLRWDCDHLDLITASRNLANLLQDFRRLLVQT